MLQGTRGIKTLQNKQIRKSCHSTPFRRKRIIIKFVTCKNMSRHILNCTKGCVVRCKLYVLCRYAVGLWITYLFLALVTLILIYVHSYFGGNLENSDFLFPIISSDIECKTYYLRNFGRNAKLTIHTILAEMQTLKFTKFWQERKIENLRKFGRNAQIKIYAVSAGVQNLQFPQFWKECKRLRMNTSQRVALEFQQAKTFAML